MLCIIRGDINYEHAILLTRQAREIIIANQFHVFNHL